jgi:hypothetical protein
MRFALAVEATAPAGAPHHQTHLEATGKVFVLKVAVRPEAKVERVHDEQVLRCQRAAVVEVQLCTVVWCVWTGPAPGQAGSRRVCCTAALTCQLAGARSELA